MVRLEEQGVKRGEHVHVFWQIKSVCGRIGPSLYDAIWAVIPNHKFGHTLIPMLHVVAVQMERAEQDRVTDFVRYLGRAVTFA